MLNMTQAQTLMQDALIETVMAYNVNNRSLINGMGAFFSGEARCPIGRMLTDEGMKMVLERKCNTGIGAQDLMYGFGAGIFKEKWRPMVLTSSEWLRFLPHLEMLHDGGHNWDPNGLSYSGEHTVEGIIRQFGLDRAVVREAIRTKLPSREFVHD